MTATKKKPKASTTGSIPGKVRSYIDGVLSGAIVACKWVRLAVERHVNDLENGSDRGLWFDESAAEFAIQFTECLKHSKDPWAGKPLILEPWQCLIFWCLYGWKRDDGRRRFNTAFISVARKNGKSTLCAALALKQLVADGEQGAEVYSAATKRDQAKIVFAEASRMRSKSPTLRKMVDAYRDSLVYGDSTYKPLGRDGDTLDGLNPSCAIIDELHAHKTREVWDVIKTGTGARANPLLIAITTAGDGDPETIYVEVRNRCQNVLSGTADDDTFFGLIYTLDDGDSWQDPAVWIKANPNLGASVIQDSLAVDAKAASETPGAVAEFRRKRCNQDVETSQPWISVDDGSAWSQCSMGNFYGLGGLTAETIARFSGRQCWAGGDLSSLSDLTALAFAFPAEDDFMDLLVACWCPRDNAIGRTRDKHVPYMPWAEQGFVTLTEGDSVDYDSLRQFLKRARDEWKWDIKQLAFDPNNARYLLTKLKEEDGFCDEGQIIEHFQTTGHMNEPIGAVEKIILDRKLRHGGNPVLRWCVSNCSIYTDTGGRRRFNKKLAREKIDLAVAMVMAVGAAVNGFGVSVYESRGVLEV
jgi:phage terminase large subunit-like protein